MKSLSLSTTQYLCYENNMMEQGFNYVNFTVRKITDFFETQLKNLEMLMEVTQANLSRLTETKTKLVLLD